MSEATHDAAPAASSRAAVLALVGASLPMSLDPAVHNIAVVAAGNALHMTGAGRSLAASIGTLCVAASILATGSFGDYLGRKKVMLLGLLVELAEAERSGARFLASTIVDGIRRAVANRLEVFEAAADVLERAFAARQVDAQLRCPGSQRREARRPPGSAGHQVRTGHQSQNGKGIGYLSAAEAAVHRR